MADVTLHCSRDHMEALLEKLEERLSTDALARHALVGKPRDELEAFTWDKTVRELTTYFKENEGLAVGLINYAFTFGGPLNDTVFMLTPLSASSSDYARRTFDPGVPVYGAREFGIDFYDRV